MPSWLPSAAGGRFIALAYLKLVLELSVRGITTHNELGAVKPRGFNVVLEP